MNKEQNVEGLNISPAIAKPILSAVFLFLDDIREPEQAFEYTKQEMFLTKKWEVVRNFDEFKSHIETNGMPSFISFDHDLADTHYTPEHLWTDYDKSKEWQEQQVHKEKTGYECAIWLVDYCIDNSLQLPNYYCHSMNPVGKDKILGLLQSFQNSRYRLSIGEEAETKTLIEEQNLKLEQYVKRRTKRLSGSGKRYGLHF